MTLDNNGCKAKKTFTLTDPGMVLIYNLFDNNSTFKFRFFSFSFNIYLIFFTNFFIARLVAVPDPQIDANCFGDTGSASISPAGGTGSYRYSWSPSPTIARFFSIIFSFFLFLCIKLNILLIY